MEKISKYINIFLWVVIGITAVLAISFIASINTNTKDPAMQSWLDTNLIWTYLLLALSIIVLIGFGLYQLFTEFKQSKKGLISLLAMGIIVLVAYLLASDEIPQFFGAQKFVEQGIISPSICKWIDTGLFTTYVFFALSLIAIGYSSISSIFK
jgi:hypothetical protein